MPKQSKAQPNRAADGAKNTFEFYEHAELGLNAESARCASRILDTGSGTREGAERGRPRQRNARRVKGHRPVAVRKGVEVSVCSK